MEAAAALPDAITNPVVHWANVQVTWDGNSYDLSVQHTVTGAAAYWLDDNLAERLGKVPDLDVTEVRVTSAEWELGGGETSVDFGEIRLLGIREPFPHAAPLQEHVAGAVREAVETARIAEGRSAKWEHQLRARAAG